jgi:chromosome segregation ATPase
MKDQATGAGVTEKVLQGIRDREKALQKQLDELDKLRSKKQDQGRELDMLNRGMKYLARKSDRYDLDIKRLEDEKEELEDQVNELEQLVDKRI